MPSMNNKTTVVSVCSFHYWLLFHLSFLLSFRLVTRILFYWVLLGFTGFYLVLLGFNEFYWVLLGFTGFYWVLPSFT